MGIFSKTKPKLSEWFLSGTVTKVTQLFGGAFLQVTNVIEVAAGDKKMHHRVWVGKQMWEEEGHLLEPGVEVCAKGEVFYGREKDGVYNKAEEIQIL